MKRIRLLLAALPLAFVAACGQTPDSTQKARGVLSGVNLFVGLTAVVVVVAVGFIVGAVAFDRYVRTRRQLAEAPVVREPEPEQDEVVAGITVGRAGVPRWLYACYVLIPVFSLTYVFSNVSVQPKVTATATPAPTGPKTTVDLAASGIKWSLKTVTVAAGQPITFNVTNNDAGVPHTFTLWKSANDAATSNKAGQISDTGQFSSGTKVVKFTAPTAGSLYFNCTIHPQAMFGTINVAQGGAAGGAPSGPSTTAKVTASGIKFDTKKLALKANSSITVDLDNKDTGVPHTFTVWKSEADAAANNASAKIADSGQFTAPKKLTFKTGPPGTWYFNCTIHPASMFGTITVS